MIRSCFIFLLSTICTLFISLCSCEHKNTITGDSKITKNYLKFCEDYSTFYINNCYKIQNNVWGFHAGSYSSTYSQCIFYDSLQPSIFGWEWELDSTSRYPSYPRVEYGWNPWVENSTTENLPRIINSLNSVNINFDKHCFMEGEYNTSFDIWITSTDTPDEENITAEMMIWFDASLDPETTVTIENLAINNEMYDFYKNTTWNTFPFFVFVKKRNIWDGQLDILPFLAYLYDNNHISSDDYLADIEFGNEIWSGEGFLELSNYNIEIE